MSYHPNPFAARMAEARGVDDWVPDYDLILEGLCPWGRALEPREGAPVWNYGWCSICDCGWRAERIGGETVHEMVLNLRVPDIFLT